jgi:hypothetical protein
MEEEAREPVKGLRSGRCFWVFVSLYVQVEAFKLELVKSYISLSLSLCFLYNFIAIMTKSGACYVGLVSL